MTQKEARDNILLIKVDPQMKSDKEFTSVSQMASANGQSIFVFFIIGILFQIFMSVSMDLIWTVLSML